jgi:hypothetical protein
MSGRRDEQETARVRGAVARRLFETFTRKGKWYAFCEGSDYIRHLCQPSVQLNEVIYPRNVFQLLPHEKQLYFWHEINCALNCSNFHAMYGHTKAYVEWHIQRVIRVYGFDVVKAWVEGAPLMPENIVRIGQDDRSFEMPYKRGWDGR